jgi:hypothetical protein
LTATVPRNLATILNETIVTGMVVLLQRCRTARLIPAVIDTSGETERERLVSDIKGRPSEQKQLVWEIITDRSSE